VIYTTVKAEIGAAERASFETGPGKVALRHIQGASREPFKALSCRHPGKCWALPSTVSTIPVPNGGKVCCGMLASKKPRAADRPSRRLAADGHRQGGVRFGRGAQGRENRAARGSGGGANRRGGGGTVGEGTRAGVVMGGPSRPKSAGNPSVGPQGRAGGRNSVGGCGQQRAG